MYASIKTITVNPGRKTLASRNFISGDTGRKHGATIRASMDKSADTPQEFFRFLFDLRTGTVRDDLLKLSARISCSVFLAILAFLQFTGYEIFPGTYATATILTAICSVLILTGTAARPAAAAAALGFLTAVTSGFPPVTPITGIIAMMLLFAIGSGAFSFDRKIGRRIIRHIKGKDRRDMMPYAVL